MEHASVVAKIEGALAGLLGKLACERGVIEQPAYLCGEIDCISGAKTQACIADHLSESAEVRGHDR
jgi:hypothetical protein